MPELPRPPRAGRPGGAVPAGVGPAARPPAVSSRSAHAKRPKGSQTQPEPAIGRMPMMHNKAQKSATHGRCRVRMAARGGPCAPPRPAARCVICDRRFNLRASGAASLPRRSGRRMRDRGPRFQGVERARAVSVGQGHRRSNPPGRLRSRQYGLRRGSTVIDQCLIRSIGELDQGVSG